jgi:MOZART (mitotic-spindle organizing protein associated with ring of gamma-tubulin) family protein
MAYARSFPTVLHEMSTLLGADLDRATLAQLLSLTEEGVNPEALAAVCALARVKGVPFVCAAVEPSKQLRDYPLPPPS